MDLDALDARLRLGRGRMAEDENRIICDRLRTPLIILDANGDNPSEWMTQSFYATYALRDGVPREIWRAECVEGFWIFKRQARQGDVFPWMTREMGGEMARLANDWLAWGLDELATACQEMEIPVTEGLELQVPFCDGPRKLYWDRSFGFSCNSESLS